MKIIGFYIIKELSLRFTTRISKNTLAYFLKNKFPSHNVSKSLKWASRLLKGSPPQTTKFYIFTLVEKKYLVCKSEVSWDLKETYFKKFKSGQTKKAMVLDYFLNCP